MKKRKLRPYVIPSISLFLACTIIFSGFQIYSFLNDYEISEEVPVISNKKEEVIKPVINDTKSII